jgi:hypothetical protein
MNCESVRRQLAVYRELSASEREGVQRHVLSCADCSRIQRAYEVQDRILCDLPKLEPALAMVEAVLARTSRRRRWAPVVTRRLGSVVALAVVALVVLLAGTLPGVAAGALPGDLLYPVKRANEQVRLTLTFDADAHAALLETQRLERLQEVQAVIVLQRDVAVEFSGTLQAVEDGVFVVDGVRVEGALASAPDGAPQIGQVVAVKAHVVSGRVAAHHVAAQQPTSMPGGVSATATDTPLLRPSPTDTQPTPTTTPRPPTPTSAKPEGYPGPNGREQVATLVATRQLGRTQIPTEPQEATPTVPQEATLTAPPSRTPAPATPTQERTLLATRTLTAERLATLRATAYPVPLLTPAVGVQPTREFPTPSAVPPIKTRAPTRLPTVEREETRKVQTPGVPTREPPTPEEQPTRPTAEIGPTRLIRPTATANSGVTIVTPLPTREAPGATHTPRRPRITPTADTSAHAATPEEQATAEEPSTGETPAADALATPGAGTVRPPGDNSAPADEAGSAVALP